MSDGMGRELAYLSSHATNRFFIPNWGIPIDIDSLSDSFSNATSPLDDVVAKDTQLLIDMVVENMPQQRQMIYRMSREQHLKNDEIAQRLGLQKKTVENHLNLALKEIKKAVYLMILLPWHWV